eukprot:CAMPEP_0203943288 /NCGR_PEP_ID=MMETSP0359-20131031/79293_1 /ASSEMBLY_ACC=CAM_ASM_000338 /TAXON_ID=268821 /ORGANISM="Scrippsiella Hangoei, Strain SHTV-5" /LENGTH=98 /DNA_ID=CAMNT_0050874139 /DNA_START=83 /DNA_END=376 /DNA_ORIENTATION=-
MTVVRKSSMLPAAGGNPVAVAQGWELSGSDWIRQMLAQDDNGSPWAGAVVTVFLGTMPGRIGMTGSAPSSDADDVDAAVEVSLAPLGDGGHAEAHARP